MLRAHCLRHPADQTPARKVLLFHASEIDPNDSSQRMRQAIGSPQGRTLYSRRIATVEPVFANRRNTKRLCCFTLRGQANVSTQWQLFCPAHNIEKLARSGWRRRGRRWGAGQALTEPSNAGPAGLTVPRRRAQYLL